LDDNVGDTDDEIDGEPRRVLDIHHKKNRSIKPPNPEELRSFQVSADVPRGPGGTFTKRIDGSDMSRSRASHSRSCNSTHLPAHGNCSSHPADHETAIGSRNSSHPPAGPSQAPGGPHGRSSHLTNPVAANDSRNRDSSLPTSGQSHGRLSYITNPVAANDSRNCDSSLPTSGQSHGRLSHTTNPEAANDSRNRDSSLPPGQSRGGSHSRASHLNDLINSEASNGSRNPKEMRNGSQFPANQSRAGSHGRPFHTNEEADSDGEHEESMDERIGKTVNRAARNSVSQGDAKPSQLGYYHGAWVNVLISARNDYRKLVHTSTPFPERGPDTLKTVHNLLLEAIADRVERFGPLDECLFFYIIILICEAH
jgi:hypothetical protein